jgi:hypothetical protein
MSERDTAFSYLRWYWALMKPIDLFCPAAHLTITQERVALRLHAHAHTKSGFTYVSADRIAAIFDVESTSNIAAARAVLVRRRFIEPAYEDGRRGWRLLPESGWLTRDGQTYQAAGPAPQTLPDRVSDDDQNSVSQTSETLPDRVSANDIEGRDQLTFQDLATNSANPGVVAALNRNQIFGATAEELAATPGLTAEAIDRLEARLRQSKLNNPAGLLITWIRSGDWNAIAAAPLTPNAGTTAARERARGQFVSDLSGKSERPGEG